MKAVKLSEPKGTVTVEDVEKPVPGAGQVLIKIEASGLCYTDVHICDGDWDVFDPMIKRDLTLGHEAIGIVESVGPEVTEFVPGDRVAAPFLRSACGKCRNCLNGNENQCPNATLLGMSHDGSHADYSIGLADYIVPVPPGIEPAQAAPLSCAGMTVYGAMRDAAVGVGTNVAVIGVGGLGHYAIQLSKVMGARTFALDLEQDKLQLALEMGADGAYMVNDDIDLAELSALDLNYVIVTAPSDAAHELAVAIVAFGGKISLCAVPADKTPISMPLAIFKGITFVSQGVATRQQLKELLDLAAAGRITSHIETRPLSEAPRAIEDVRNRAVIGRVVLIPDNE